jgi:DNA-binding CsgD family transcriptional regulator
MVVSKECDIVISEIENKIICMIAREMPNKEIAYELNYSQRMIEYNISMLLKKFNVSTRVGLVSKAYQKKILKLSQSLK